MTNLKIKPILGTGIIIPQDLKKQQETIIPCKDNKEIEKGIIVDIYI